MMHIVLISGSHRRNSQSLRIAQYLSLRLRLVEPSLTNDIIELKENPLPLWDESMWESGSSLNNQWQPYAKRLQAADGLVVISPEWSGMVPSGLKNFFLYCSPKDIGHKPGLIVAVSSSHGGAYPVNELRTSSYKNTMLCYIPEHLIVRNAEKIFVGDTAVDKEDEYMRGRADYTLKILIAYTQGLKSVRDSGVTVDKKYPFGM
jgi:azobenzene reductase